MDNRKGVDGRLFTKTISVAAVILLVLLAMTFVASAGVFVGQPCAWNVSCTDVCCEETTTEGWFYNMTPSPDIWESERPNTALFHLRVDSEEYDAYCINLEKPLSPGDTFNASIYVADPTCKNNSIAYILNNWTHNCANCPNVSAAQSAIWYFWYINESFCSLGTPEYNHTAVPPFESRWIPNCTAHPLACTMINASINKSVPYAIVTTPLSGSYPKGTPIVLTATVSYCAGEEAPRVTVVFVTDKGNVSESGSPVYENVTTDGIITATLVCGSSVDSAHVIVRLKDMHWFDIVEPCNGQQETLKIMNITDDVAFTFYTEKVPVLTPFGIAVLIGLLSVVVVFSISKGMRRKRE